MEDTKDTMGSETATFRASSTVSQRTASPGAPSIHLYSLYAQRRITFEVKTLSNLLLFITGHYTLDVKLQTSDYSKYVWKRIRRE